jgi:Rap1a immunity proteins
MRLIGITALATALISSNALGAGMGTDLYEDCVTAEKGSDKDALCSIYVYGISAGIWMAQTMQDAGQPFCLPREGPLDFRQARAIVEKFMRDHPEGLNAKSPLVVAGALKQAFPCKGSN